VSRKKNIILCYSYIYIPITGKYVHNMCYIIIASWSFTALPVTILNTRGFTPSQTLLNVNFTDFLHGYSGCFNQIHVKTLHPIAITFFFFVTLYEQKNICFSRVDKYPRELLFKIESFVFKMYTPSGTGWLSMYQISELQRVR